MAQDPQNQYYPNNSQPQNNNYNPQNYDSSLVDQNNYSQGQINTDPNASYQHPIDTLQPLQTMAQTYDPSQYYQPQPVMQNLDPINQYSQPQNISYPFDATQSSYQTYPQTDIYNQNQTPAYQYDTNSPSMDNNFQPVTNYNSVTNTFDQSNQNFTPNPLDPNLSPVQDYSSFNQEFASQPQTSQFSQDQFNNFEPTYNSESQFDNQSIPESAVHEGGFFANKKNFIIIGLVVLVVGLISASGILFYLASQENSTTTVQTTQISSAVTTNPSTVTNTSKTTTATLPTPSSQAGRAVAVGTTDSGGPGTPATNAKKTSLTKIPLEWTKAKFTAENLNDDGSCKVLSICGEKSEPDNDGLTNIDEYNFQTDPLNPDTDLDGVSDGDEVHIYYTDPTKKDSDNDTFEDGDEITNCYDPITATKNKLSAARKNQMTTIATTMPLHKTTLDKLKKANATNEDLDKGYIQIKCGETNSLQTSSGSNPVVKPTKNNI
jgi:hypothetical protein